MKREKIKSLVLVFVVLCFPVLTHASFEESNVPTSVQMLYCDNNPRILVQFADASKNIWYPANSGDQSKNFLAVAMAAKTASQKLWYYGFGDPLATTSYCLSVTARQIQLFGLAQ